MHILRSPSNRLIFIRRIPLLPVGEDVIEDRTYEGQDEDENGPSELVAWWAVRLQDLDCRCQYLQSAADENEDVLQTMISITRTMKPITPPPAPNCCPLFMPVLCKLSSAMGAASDSEARQIWRMSEDIL